MKNQPDQQPQSDQPTVDTGRPVTGKLAALRKDPKGWITLILAVAAVIAFFGAAFGAGIGLWGWKAGLAALPWCCYFAWFYRLFGELCDDNCVASCNP